MEKVYVHLRRSAVFDEKKVNINSKEFYVLPVSMMTPGKRCGLAGCLNYSEKVLSEFPSVWNGIPVTNGHPMDEDGETPLSVTASPNVFHSYYIGATVHNAHYDNGLRGDIYIRSEDMTEELLQKFKSQNIEVSIGVFCDVEGDNVTSMYPDHLALLFNEKGACSWEDGCGIRANASGEDAEKKDANEINLKKDDVFSQKDLSFRVFIGNNSKWCESKNLQGVNGMDKKDEKVVVEDADKGKQGCPECTEPTLKDNKQEEAVETKSVLAPVEGKKKLSFNELLNQVEPEVRESLLYSLNLAKQAKESAIEKILAYKSGVFTKEELAKKSVEELQKLVVFCAPKEEAAPEKTNPMDYLLQGLGNFVDNSGPAEEPLEDVWAETIFKR